MDPHAAWLRRVVLAHLGRTAGALWTLASLLALAVARSQGLSWSVSVPWAVLFGQVLVFLCLGGRLVSGPLSGGYLRRYTERSLAFRAEPLGCSSDADLAEVMDDLGLRPVTSLATSLQAGSDQSPTYEVFGSADRITFVSRPVGGGATLVLSALRDGRYLVTTDFVLIPNRLLVVNLQSGRGPARLVGAHEKVVGVFSDQGLPSVPSSPAVVAAVLRCEQESFAALGPILGSFLSLDGSTARWRLSAGIAAADLRRLAGRTRGPQRPKGRALGAETPPGAIGPLEPVASTHHA